MLLNIYIDLNNLKNNTLKMNYKVLYKTNWISKLTIKKPEQIDPKGDKIRFTFFGIAKLFK